MKLTKAFIGSMIFLAGAGPASAQEIIHDHSIIAHYTEADKVPSEISDLQFDDQGFLWLATETDNLRIFDGAHLRILPTTEVKGVPQFAYARILKAANHRIYFQTQKKEFFLQLNKAGLLSFDSAFSANTPTNKNGYGFFNWSQFIASAADARTRAERQALQARLLNNPSLTAFNDSTFFFEEGPNFYLYLSDRLRAIGTQPFDPTQSIILDNRLLVLEQNHFLHVDTSSGKKQAMPFGGDILRDSLFPAYSNNVTQDSARLRIRVFRSAHPHILFNNRLYRLDHITGDKLTTVLVCALAPAHARISKVEYEPQQNITAFSTMGDGLFIVSSNPFSDNRFAEPFLTAKRKHIYFPLTVKDNNHFRTSWGEFSTNGSYTPLDLQHQGPQCLYTDHYGNVWEGIDNKLIEYDRKMLKQRELSLPELGAAVKDVCEGQHGELYCLGNRAIFQYDSGALRQIPAITDTAIRTPCCFQQFLQAKDGLFWIASAKGLYTFDGNNKMLTKVKEVPDVFTINLTQLADGAILFTCYPEAFYYLYYKKRFCKIPVEGDLPLKEISSVLEDRRGRIWLATSSGLFVTSRQEIEAWCDGKIPSIYYYHFGKSEGLQDLEFNGGLNRSNGISGDGYLAFNSMGGIQLFHQDSARPVFPTDAQLTIVGKSGEETLPGDSLDIGHSNEGLFLRVYAPYFANRKNLDIEYTLSPGMDSWQEVDASGRIHITHLAHGSYQLLVRARTGLGASDYRIRGLVIAVPSLFYETTLFAVLVTVALLAIAFFLVLWIIRLRRVVRMKNLILQDRNAKLEDALIDLGESTELKEKLISLILHDLKAPLYFQSLVLNQIVEADSFSDEETRALFRDLRGSSAATLQFTKEFLTWYSIQRDGFRVQNEAFDHLVIVNKLFAVYADIAAKNNLYLHSESKGDRMLYTDRNILEIIIRNLLDNAIKYTTTGGVTLTFEKRTQEDAIIVADTGKGMTAEKVRVLQEGRPEVAGESPETFGYRFIHVMAGKIGASISIQSKTGEGTSVTILLPH